MFRSSFLALFLLLGAALAQQPIPVSPTTSVTTNGTSVPGSCTVPAFFVKTDTQALYMCIGGSFIAVGGGGGGTWGSITGTLSNQTDLNSALTGKVSTTTTVNGHALSSNVTVTKSDVGLGSVPNTDPTALNATKVSKLRKSDDSGDAMTCDASGNCTANGNVLIGATVAESTPLATPSSPVITQGGTPGVTSYSYACARVSEVGTTVLSANGSTTTGNATLDGTNYNIIACGATGGTYDIWRTAGGSFPHRIVSGLSGPTSFHDTGIGDDVGVPVRNTTAGIFTPNLNVSGGSCIGSSCGIDVPNEPIIAVLGTSALNIYEKASIIDPADDGGSAAANAMSAMITCDLSSPASANSAGCEAASLFALQPSGTNPAGYLVGAWLQAESDASTSSVTGFLSYANLVGSGSTTTFIDAFRSESLGNGGTATDLTFFHGLGANNSGTLTNYKGVWLESPSNSGTITNAYGVLVENVSAGTNNWAIKTNAGKVEHGDVVQIDPLADVASLPACNAGAEGSMRPVQNSDTNTWGATVVHTTGSFHVLAYCNGTNWTVMAK